MRSKPAGFIDDIAQFLAGEETTAIIREDFVAALVEIGAIAGGMRRDQDARQRPQRMLGRQWLLLEHIERGAGDLAGFQRRDKVVEPGGSAASNIDEERAALHALEPRPVHEALG